MNVSPEERFARVLESIRQSGKPVKNIGTMTKLPLDEASHKHFMQHGHDHVYRSTPVMNTGTKIDGLYASIWVTDKYDHVPVVYISKQVMDHILYDLDFDKNSSTI